VIRTRILLSSLIAATLSMPAVALAVPLLLPLDDPPSGLAGQPALTVQQQEVEIVISDEHATTRITQVLRNHTGQTREGTYLFPLPQGGAVSDFACWDDGIRIPGVVLEREEARRIYNSIVRRRIDPGLVEEQEGNLFSVQVFPIPPYGTKRLEMEFTQLLDVDSGGVRYQFPLAMADESDRIDTFSLAFEVRSSQPITDLTFPAERLDVVVDEQSGARVRGHLDGRGFLASQDFAMEYVIQTSDLGVRALSHREADLEEDGYFLVSVLPSMDLAGQGDVEGRDLVLLFDTSYSMMGDGLEGSVEAARALVASLGANDRVTAMTFGDDVAPMEGGFLPGGEASADAVERFVRTASLGAGTDLRAALLKGLGATAGSSRGSAVVLITDGHQTVGNIDLQKIERDVLARAGDTRIFTFSVGQGTEDPLLKHLADRTWGHFEHVRGYGDLRYRLARFLEKLDLPLLIGPKVRVPGRTDRVYPGELADTFVGSRLLVVGRYRTAVRGGLKVEGTLRGDPIREEVAVSWSGEEHGEAYVARLWARARVDHLLERIHMEGYRDEWRDEIVELARRYKFVTPYTSFLAAPRALLRPRVIKPGDPVLHIRAPEGTELVSVVFPFGETKPAAYDAARGLWVCRFLVPVGMEDGGYDAIVVVTDAEGRLVRERKRFVVDSHPPEIDVALSADRIGAGEELRVRVDAPPDTGHIVATLMRPAGGELLRVPVRWDDGEAVNVGAMTLPDALSPGRYAVFVHATDFAYNETGRHVELEVL
jgi:Ca-activated chloride channel homolog